MSPIFDIKTGLVTGRDHILSGKNCQDAVRVNTFLMDEEEYSVAFICDGCSSGKYSEVGANLGADFLIRQSKYLLFQGLSIPVVASILFEDLKGYLWWIMNGQTIPSVEQPLYIQDHFLFTVLGFIAGNRSIATIAGGDGVIGLNRKLTILDCENEPPYIGYHLVDPSCLSENRRRLPENFDINIYKTSDVESVVIGSDSWISYQTLLNEIYELGHPSAIQRKMNV